MAVFLLMLVLSCENNRQKSIDLLREVDPNVEGQWVNMVVEIPAGSIEKWEVNKTNGKIEPDSLNGETRIIDYLGYPGNYGFIPQSILLKSAGGDGDPIDVLVIGKTLARGTIVRCKIIGALKLLDNGEQDDKLIAISEGSPLSQINSLTELSENHQGTLEIIEVWFTNYKGVNKMKSKGYLGVNEAQKILNSALKGYSFE